MMNCAVIGLLVVLLVATSTAQLMMDQNFDDAQVYWPSQIKRSSDGFALPGLRGLRGKRDPTYHKRVPMMSLKGLRGKRARFYGEQLEQ